MKTPRKYHYLIVNEDQYSKEIILQNVKKHNAFNAILIQELRDEIKESQRSSSLKTIILRGEGASFCAGADLEWMKSFTSASKEENLLDAQHLFHLFQDFDQYEGIIIGLVHGKIMGGGIGLCAICDIVLAHEDSQFSLSEVKIGLAPAVISSFVMRKMGSSLFSYYALTGRFFKAEEALNAHLVHKLFNDENKVSLLNELKKDVLSGSHQAQLEIKKLVKRLMNSNQCENKEIFDYTTNLIAVLRTSPEGVEGLNAILEKRPPQWIRSIVKQK